MAIVIGIGVLLLLWARPRLFGRGKRDPMEDAPSRLSVSQQRHHEREMQRLIVELAETSRQLNAQLETRAARLEALLEEARQASEELRQTISASRAAGGGLGGGDGPSLSLPPSNAPRPVRRDPTADRICELAEEGQNAEQIARELGRPRGEVELILALRGS